MNQNRTIQKIQKILNNLNIYYRLIKIHGGPHQEAGLPDLLLLMRRGDQTRVAWLELKSSWTDRPTSLQRWNVESSLRKFGVRTAYAVGEEVKTTWEQDTPVSLTVWLEEVLAGR